MHSTLSVLNCPTDHPAAIQNTVNDVVSQSFSVMLFKNQTHVYMKQFNLLIKRHTVHELMLDWSPVMYSSPCCLVCIFLLYLAIARLKKAVYLTHYTSRCVFILCVTADEILAQLLLRLLQFSSRRDSNVLGN